MPAMNNVLSAKARLVTQAGARRCLCAASDRMTHQGNNVVDWREDSNALRRPAGPFSMTFVDALVHLRGAASDHDQVIVWDLESSA